MADIKNEQVKYAEVAKRIKTVLNKDKVITVNTPVPKLKAFTNEIFNSSKIVMKDGSALNVWTPDGTGAYANLWTRDFAYLLEGYLDYFTADDIEKTFRYIAAKSNPTTYEVPDNIDRNGKVIWKPGNRDEFGKRASGDGGPFLVDILYHHYKKTGSTSLYCEHKEFLLKIMDEGIPYNGTTGCAYIDDNDPFVSYGFIDTIMVTGDVLFLSLLCYQAYIQLTEMAYEASDWHHVEHFNNRAEIIKAGINSTLWSGNSESAPLYQSATIKGHRQRDIWGSAFAVWLGVADEVQTKAIANYLINNKSDYCYKGGIRHVPKSSDYIAGEKVWEAYYLERPYGIYQNGGYWATPISWVCFTINKLNTNVATNLLEECIENQVNSLPDGPFEWMAENDMVGIQKYTANASLPLILIKD